MTKTACLNLVILAILAFLFLFLKPFTVQAQETVCSDQASCQDAINKYTAELNKLGAQKNTLKNQISSYNSQIQLTSVQIEQTKFQIASLSARINNLEGSLNHLSEVFHQRTVKSYELTAKLDPLAIFLSSENFGSFIERLKYLKVIQINDRNLMIQLEETRTNYDDQKTTAQLLAKRLDAQKIKLSQLKTESARLLTATENDEAKYQQLLSQARSQLSAFRRFVSSQGGASILQNQTVCSDWGCYFNQRDSSWGNMALGSSSYSVADAGCLISASAMVATHYKKNINPGNIAADPSSFFGSTGWMWKDVSVGGTRIVRTSVAPTTANIDSELSAGRPVIVGLFWSDGSPEHFIVLKSGSSGNYVMNDPFMENGHDINFTNKYKLSNITDVEKVYIY